MVHSKNDVYLPRLADDMLEAKLAHARAVVVRGPKWCGKTRTSERHAKSTLYLQNPREAQRIRLAIQVDPAMLLEGEKPRLVDEWQDAPQIWDAIRFEADRSYAAGQFILTGSSTPGEKPKHSGTGRFSFLDMRAMSLIESKESTGQVSLRDLFEGKKVFGSSDASLDDIAYIVCRGGWPAAVTAGGEPALETAYDYLSAVAEEDISRVDGIRRSAEYARLVMSAYARCTATMADIETIRRNIRTQRGEIARNTVDSYISAFRKLYIFEDLGAWRPSLRSKARINTTPTRHFVDPSLAAASMGASPQMLMRDITTLGLLFESLCIRDLRIYAEYLKGTLLRYHDQSGLETDAIIAMRDGRWGAVEVKLGEGLVEEGVKSLLDVARKVDQDVMGAPSFLAVVIPTGYAYRRNDGVYVVPITCLAP